MLAPPPTHTASCRGAPQSGGARATRGASTGREDPTGGEPRPLEAALERPRRRAESVTLVSALFTILYHSDANIAHTAACLYSLDFLRKCRELSEWYGPSFYFVANPLMLPFPLHPFLEQRALDVEPQVPHAVQCIYVCYCCTPSIDGMCCVLPYLVSLCFLTYCNVTTTYLTASLLP